MERTSIRRSVVAASLAVAMIVGTVVLARAGEERGNQTGEHERWMTGDWHQHTFFTDGSNFMGDVEIDFSTTPPTFKILTNKYTDASPNFAPVREGASGKNEYKGGMAQGFRYGLDFQANSEHGGPRGARDGFGRFWADPVFYPMGVDNIPLLGANATYTNVCTYENVDSPSCTSSARKVMWRWQELANYSGIISGYGDNYMSAFDWITTLRGQFHDREILTGMEWNVPGHEHASSGCLEAGGKCIAEFEYRFDRDDTDTTGPAFAGMSWGGKILASAYTTANGYKDYSSVLGLSAAHNKAIDGLKWLNANHPDTAWVNPAHVERAGCQVGGYSIAALRDMNDAAPTVFFGFEGMPGHQKASNRGEFGTGSCGVGSYGGAGTYIATVGGVWDSLLGDGRKFFNFVSSDFHMTRDDFYPGEYSKTYVKVKDNERKDGTSTQRDILDGLRSGNSFAVHGDLIDELDFRVFSGAPFGGHSATMGETLTVGSGEKVTAQIRFKSPSHNNCKAGVNASAGFDCASYRPNVHHVQLIQGRVNPTRAMKLLSDGTPNPAFNFVDGGIASVVKIFDATNWKKDEDGFTTMRFEVRHLGNDSFFRIRGTNKEYNEAGQTDEMGDPLLDTPGTNTADEAWKDLWFYSNPIFVKVQGR